MANKKNDLDRLIEIGKKRKELLNVLKLHLEAKDIDNIIRTSEMLCGISMPNDCKN